MHTKQNNKQGVNPGVIRWSHPRIGYVKLNFDGSVVSQRAASGFMIRNDLGLPILVGACGVGQSPINVMECSALRDRLRLAASSGH